MKALALFFTFVLIVLITGCGPADSVPAAVPRVSERVTMTVGGVNRAFTIRVPERTEGEKLPVVVGIHGVGDEVQSFEDYTGFSARVQADQFIAVYPEGLPLPDGRRVWNAGSCCTAAGATPADDIGFLSALFDKIIADYGADPAAIFVAGFSNGGMLTYRVACDLGNRIAGIAVVSGALNVLQCTSTNPLPVLIVHGTADTTVPYAGGSTVEAQSMGITYVDNTSVWNSAEYWVTRNGCGDNPTATSWQTIEETKFTGCTAGSSLAVYTINGGEHIWPTGSVPLDVTSLILDTFIRGS